MDAYQTCLQKMYGLRRFGIKLGLDTIQHILGSLDNPQTAFRSIHIAGTNGKGSIASYLATILNKAGYNVGLYTSPHLVRFNERIRINGRPIADKDVVKSFEAVQSVGRGTREPTFFEYTTAMALYYFGQHPVDWAVIETGMGGRLDATNMISPVVSIISNVSLEHKDYLGNTLAEIAYEKGGIIKPNTPTVTGVKQKAAVEVITTIANQRSAPVYRSGTDFRVRRQPNLHFAYYGLDHSWRDLTTALPGRHQIDNAAIALAACEIAMRQSTHVSENNIRDGLLQTRWPGRLEVVSQKPYILLDGAHNFMAARKLADYLVELRKKHPIILVIGILDDKPYRAILHTLLPLCDHVILTRPRIDRALAPEVLHTVAQSITSSVEIIPHVHQAVQSAMRRAKPNEAICIAGSLYVVGEAKEVLEKQTSDNCQ